MKLTPTIKTQILDTIHVIEERLLTMLDSGTLNESDAVILSNYSNSIATLVSRLATD